MPFTGTPTAVLPTTFATSSAATGWMNTGARWTTLSTVAEAAMLLTNSKNCVACTIEYGIDDSRINFSCATFARMYALSASRSVPTTDSAT
jgi:hypothetical protein